MGCGGSKGDVIAAGKKGGLISDDADPCAGIELKL